MDLNNLLIDVKTTVEGLLSMPTANVWSIYGGLKRLCACVENVLNHGLKYSHKAGKESTLDYNQFIRSLQWLNPVLAPSSDKIRKLSLEENISEGKAWVRHSLQSHTLRAQLVVLVGDRQHLTNCYYEYAFLCHADYFAAFCLCLEAVEKNRPSLLTNIDHSLLLHPNKTRTTTLPFTRHPSDTTVYLSEPSTPTVDPLTNEVAAPFTLTSRNSRERQQKVTSEERAMRNSVENSALDSILNTEEGGSDVPHSPQSNPKTSKGKQPMKGHQRSKSDLSFLKAQLQTSKSATDLTNGPSLSSSLPGDEFGLDKRIRDASKSKETPMFYNNDSYFPQPTPGESLKSYLSSQDFDTCAELDRENAHFAISEALMAAIEHMKWNQVLRPSQPAPVLQIEDTDAESDEEIVRLKRKIQERRKLRKSSKLLTVNYSEKSSSGATPKSSSHSNSVKDSDSLFSDEDMYGSSGFSDTDSLLTLRDGVPLSNSKTSMAEPAPVIPSADQVALSLLSHFNEYHLPKADQLIWLVSEKEAPQALLPLPDSMPISPDDMNEGRKGTRIRGNAEWAPPRPQIIFNIHPPQGRKVLISKQNYRCAGCGTKIEQGYLKRFRYCEYLGKYFCHCCHTNNTSIIPAKILHKWDFSKYPVSNFSRDLLLKMAEDPLFNLLDINRGILHKVKTLQQITLSRLQLRLCRIFLASCRLGTEVYSQLLSIPEYLLDDVHLYSITDLKKAKNKALDKSLRATAQDAISHVLECTLCKAKGFICEICNDDKEVIFPFQFDKVIRCNFCLSCFHSTCYAKRGKNCPKCARIEARKMSLADTNNPDGTAQDS
ncbi:run domain Beclin-1-interacting and cysteine-rich domain-containing protein-like isoform X1 [Watersipora subatra]|uniref:run domain Beclin-1-interacting and cysteine-rich domain-containing protein-like isoform X1 n=2 Tax=Watersipora subatra TaxID=2589382 RepID=UPI00355BE3CB